MTCKHCEKEGVLLPTPKNKEDFVREGHYCMTHFLELDFSQYQEYLLTLNVNKSRFHLFLTFLEIYKEREYPHHIAIPKAIKYSYLAYKFKINTDEYKFDRNEMNKLFKFGIWLEAEIFNGDKRKFDKDIKEAIEFEQEESKKALKETINHLADKVRA